MNLEEAFKAPNVNIVDVREYVEYLFGHASGAINIPLSKLKDNVNRFKNMEGPIILYCRSGNRSGQAEGFLRLNEVGNVFNGGSISAVRAQLAKGIA